jgi:hypothetical protein
MVCDGKGYRCDLGSTIPISGRDVHIRNPFSHNIKGRIYRDHPVSFGPKRSCTDIEFASTLRVQAAKKTGGILGRRQAAIFMPRDSQMFFTAYGFASMNFAVLPNAKESYLFQLPNGVLDQDLIFYNDNGEVNNTVIGKQGSYTQAEMAQWIADTGWGSYPIELSNDLSSGSVSLDPNTAAIAFYHEDSAFEVSVKAYDLGNWSPERID